MRIRGQRAIASCGAAFAVVAATACACGIGAALAGDAAPQKPPELSKPTLPPGVAPPGPLDVKTVTFADRRLAPVRLVRGPRRPPAVLRPISKQIVSFGEGGAQQVTVVRGAAVMPMSLVRQLDPGKVSAVETISFADPRQSMVTVLRGPSPNNWAFFGLDPTLVGDLDRVAFAVDGVESRHGADQRMWRPEPNGPQGPMQVSAAAALDVGGGDRFDLLQNRLLGRAYLGQMYHRYGNWADALAAYNWGPGNMDQWIARGRTLERLPAGVAWYVSRVLRDATGRKTAGR